VLVSTMVRVWAWVQEKPVSEGDKQGGAGDRTSKIR